MYNKKLLFILGQSPEEIAKDKEVQKSELYSSCIPSPEAVDELHN